MKSVRGENVQMSSQSLFIFIVAILFLISRPQRSRPKPIDSASRVVLRAPTRLVHALRGQYEVWSRWACSRSALGLVSVGTHEVHPLDRYVLLLDGLLHAVLVLPEAVGARVTAAVALQELLGEPAVKTLVVLPLQVGTRFADAVHLRRPGRNGGDEAKRWRICAFCAGPCRDAIGHRALTRETIPTSGPLLH